MVTFTRSLLAVTREYLAEALTHSELTNLFEIHGFSPRQGSAFNNKLQKCSAYLDHNNWDQAATNERLNSLLSEARVRRPHFFLSDFQKENPNHPSMKLSKALGKLGISWDGDQYVALGSTAFQQSSVHEVFDLGVLHREMSRAKENIERDPDDAITASENIVVSASKHVLDELKVEYTERETAPQILNKAMGALKLVPDEISESQKGADSIKKILRSLMPIVQGLAELRNLYGDSHGKGKAYKGLYPRHARLMVGASETVATFLLETLMQRVDEKEIKVSVAK
jgi:hypothetical protein